VLRGIDVSSWQGQPGQWLAEAGDFDFGAVKISEVAPDGSREINPYAEADWHKLEELGKLRLAYLFGHPGASVADTLEVFRGQLARLRLEDHDAIGLDLEVTDGRNPAQVSVWARQVLRGLESAYSRKPACYTYISFGSGGNCSGLEPWPLWIAAPSDPPGQPQVPGPWKDWALQQVSIAPPLDRDVARWSTAAEFARALGKAGAAPPADPPVPPKRDIERWATWGRWSLDREAQEHQTTPDEMLACAGAMGHHYGAPMREYVSRGDFSARLPAGSILYAPKRRR
jgi:lysozyme